MARADARDARHGKPQFAVRGLADALRNELVGTGVRVSIAYPPDTDTPVRPAPRLGL
jgi:NAD(P)-dependent dehydrogenase (short-subunit alcohol dehydrogenase family)